VSGARARHGLLLLLLSLTVFVTVSPILGYSFTGSEIFRVLVNSRAGPDAHMFELLKRPYMILPPSRDVKQYYRPVTTLSFALDQHVWGSSAFGYHLLDLLAHLGVTLLFYGVVLRLSNGHIPTALLAALLYVLHPLISVVVPNLVRRGDLLAALAYLGSFYAFLRGRGRIGGRGWTVLSVGAYALALGCKEIAAVLPFLLAGYLYVLAPHAAKGRRGRLARSLRETLPHLILTAAYGVLWWWVTAGSRFARGVFFGPILRESPWETVSFVFAENLRRNILGNYLQYLLHPPLQALRFLAETPLAWPRHPLRTGLILLAAGLVLSLVWPARRTWKDLRRGNPAAGLRLFLGLCVLGSLILLAAHPILEPGIREAVSNAYHHPEGSWLSGFMESRGRLGPDHYQRRARSLYLGGLWTLMMVSLGVLFAWDLAGRIPRRPLRSLDSRIMRLTFFFGMWALLPAAVHMIALMVPTWRAYQGLFGASALAALGLVAWGRALGRRFERFRGPRPARGLRALTDTGSTAVLATVLSVTILATSPLFGLPEFWRLSSRVRKHYLEGLRQSLRRVPPGHPLEVVNFPDLPPDGSARSHMTLRPRDMAAWIRPELTVRVTRENNPRLGLSHMQRCCRFGFQLAPEGAQPPRRLIVLWDRTKSEDPSPGDASGNR